MYQPRKKKRDKTGLWVFLGCGVLLIILLSIVVKAGAPKKKRPSVPEATGVVNLPEGEKKEMYRSLFALKGMLRGAGGDPNRSYRVLADRYGVTEEAVRLVEAEGRRNSWPH